MLDSTFWATDQLQRHSLDSRQFLDFRESRLPNGMRIIEAYNGSGLHFTLLPDRGLDIWTAHYKGIPLTWVAPGSPFPPDFGAPWLQQWCGGLLTTCGLRHVGQPETDADTGEYRDLHGHYTRLRAHDVKVNRSGVESIDLSGVVNEGAMHGDQLELVRMVSLNLGEPTIHIADVVTNLNDKPVPLMILYHINPGYPLLAGGTRLHAPDATVYPLDEYARLGLNQSAEYAAAAPQYRDQVYFHHVKAGENGETEVALLHEKFGLSIVWNSTTLPYLSQWKNTRQGMYITGIEPGNCIPEGQNAAKQAGRLRMLAPGESETFNCRISLIEGGDGVEAARQRIASLAQNGRPVELKLEDYAAAT
jgi:hypothetical protein